MTAYLRIAVFLAGFGILGAEMVAPRLLAPAFGSSQLVWTNVIGTILAALTLGAWLGGKLADRRPTEQGFGWMLFVGGTLIALVPLAARPWLAGAVDALSEQRAGDYLISLAASSLLFAPGVLVLGAVAPYAVRLGGWGRPDLGRVAGELSALGALGSIAGTFATSLALLPLLGSRTTLLVTGAVLAGAGAFRALRPTRAVAVLVPFLGLGLAYQGPIRFGSPAVYETESLYSYLKVTRDSSGWLRLSTNESSWAQSVWPSRGILTGGVWDYLALTPALVARTPGELRVLVVGLATGTVARQVEAAYGPDERVSIHGVELDPAVVEAGQRYFGLGEIAGLSTEIADGRVAIRRLGGRFHAIVIDVYRGIYLPQHLATREFFEICRRRLEPGGVLAFNVVTPIESGWLLGAVAATLEDVFPSVRLMRLPSGSPVTNAVLFASDGPIEAPASGAVPEELRSIGLALEPAEFPAEHRRILTDDHAPVEWLTDLALLEALR